MYQHNYAAFMCKLQLNSRNVLYKKRIIILIKGKRKKERMNEHNITYHNKYLYAQWKYNCIENISLFFYYLNIFLFI